MNRKWRTSSSSSRQVMCSYLSLLILMGICCFPAVVSRQLSVTGDEVIQLMTFKQSSVDSDPSGFLADWTSSSSSPCRWRGVSCSGDGKVNALNLSGAGLVGRLHLSDLMALTGLTHLYFSGNFFSGNLSSSTKFCSFVTIDLSANNFSEPLAGESPVASCQNLVSLNLSRNAIPSGVLNIGPSLRQLDLSRNRISDSALLSSTLLSCRNLNMLNFSDNKLGGNLYVSLSSCKSLSIVDLSYNRFSGEIPATFVSTSPDSLKILDLSHNNFTGDIHGLQIGPCRNLTVLNLSYNSLNGTGFPIGLSNCRLLETIDFRHNAINLRIPSDLFGSLNNLRRLSLANNKFWGNIPAELGQTCGTLEALDLAGNQLTGGLPSTFLSCSSLVTLNLGNNLLSGDFLTTVVSSLTSLRILNVPFNNLTGEVPLSITKCTQLRVLDLSSNSFTGEIPSGFCSQNALSSLEKILLPDNNLTGTIPANLGNCKNLKTVDFSFNSLSGSIPIEIWRLPNLSDIIIWANELTGEIPEGICITGGNLQTMILNNNRLTGKLPQSIVNCTNLIWVSLSSNRLTGSIPSGVDNLQNLAILQMGNNSLTGAIPPGLGKCRSLIWLDLNSNSLSGSIPEELAFEAGNVVPGIVSGKQFAFVRNEGGTSCRGAGGLVEFEGIRSERLVNFPMVHSCPSIRIYSGVTFYTFITNGSMIYVDLSYNSLSGPIPENLGSLSFVQVLNLGHNDLTGNIPFGLGGLKAVGVLDLSHNNLQGFIPGSLGSLTFLSDLDVSNNRLTGPIPSGGQLTTFPSSRYENNSGLCGVPLPPCGGGNGRRRYPVGVNGHDRKKSLAVGASIGIIVSLLTILVLVFALYRAKRYQRKEERREKYIDSLPTSGSSSWKLSSVPEPLSINVATFEKPLRKLTFGHLLEATNGFSADTLIGTGGFGEVYKAQLKDGCVVAIKKLIQVTGQGDREFTAEMETIGKIKHRNLVPLMGYCKIGDERLLVYEYMKWGSLESVLHGRDGPKLDWPARKKIATGAARGLAFLHHSCVPRIIHRDMKSSNVLLDENLDARVSDFGMARLLNALDTHLSVSTLAGTPGYVPPEYYQSFRCTAKGDVYSYGVVLLELLSSKRPIDPVEFGDDTNLVGWAKMMRRENKSHEIIDSELIIDKHVEGELCHYLRIAFECLDDKPFRRPTMIQVIAMLKEMQVDSTLSESLDGISVENSVIDEVVEMEC